MQNSKMMKIAIILVHECKKESVWGIQWGEREKEESIGG
jgi:hypothetical protein